MLFLFLGPNNVFTRLSVFFSEVAVVSFGSAYAVLAGPHVAPAAVDFFDGFVPARGWRASAWPKRHLVRLSWPCSMSAFLVGYRCPDTLPPLLAAALAGLLVTWLTFTPCFLWVFLGAPYVEALQGVRALPVPHCPPSRLPSMGGVLNLAVWFGVHVIFRKTGAWLGFGSKLCIPVPIESRRLCGASGDRGRSRHFTLQRWLHSNAPRLLPRGGGGAAGVGVVP